MERIGIAASKLAKGNIVLYNLYVIFLAFFFSLFMFVVVGSCILFALIIVAQLGSGITAINFDKSWRPIVTVCMVTLTIVVGVFNLLALSRNLRIRKFK